MPPTNRPQYTFSHVRSWPLPSICRRSQGNIHADTARPARTPSAAPPARAETPAAYDPLHVACSTNAADPELPACFSYKQLQSSLIIKEAFGYILVPDAHP